MTPQQLHDYLLQQIRSGGENGLTLASEARDFLSELIDSVFAAISSQVAISNQQLDGLVPINGDTTINNIKTFTTLPQSTAVPALDAQLVNKKYVDDEITDANVSGNFDSNKLIKRQVPGLENVNLNKTTIKDTLQELLYPEKSPLAMVSGNNLHYYGDDTDAQISYTITRTDGAITSADINGVPITVTGDSQSGVLAVPNNPNGDKTFLLTVVAGTKTVTASYISRVIKPIYAGSLAKDGITQGITNNDVLTLKEFSSEQAVIDAKVNAGNYLVIAVPSDFGKAFLINGLNVNSFNIFSLQTFVNEFGYTSDYLVYASTFIMPGNNMVEFFALNFN